MRGADKFSGGVVKAAQHTRYGGDIPVREATPPAGDLAWHEGQHIAAELVLAEHARTGGVALPGQVRQQARDERRRRGRGSTHGVTNSYHAKG